MTSGKPHWQAYAFAGAATAVALGLRLLADPWISGRLPYLTFFAAVALTVWRAGVWPAVASAAAGFILANIFVPGHAGSSSTLGLGFAVALFGYALSSGVIIAFGASVQRNQARLEAEIRDRRSAELAALDEARRLQATLQSIGDGVIVTDVAGNVTILNPVAERLTGWSQEQARNQPLSSVFDIANESTRERIDSPAVTATHESRAVGSANYVILRSKDCTEHAIVERTTPISSRDGSLLGAVSVFQDVTARYEAERQLRLAYDALEHRVETRTIELTSQRAFLEAVLEAIEDAVVACGPDGRLSLFNRAAREFHGLPAQPLPPDQWAEHFKLYRSDGVSPLPTAEIPLFCALAGERVRDAEMVIRPAGGSPRTVLASGEPLLDAKGIKLGAVISMHDITDRRENETIRKLVADLAAVSERKTKFLAVLAHELRNPLAPIKNGLHVMRMRPDDGPLVAKTRDMMERQLAHMVKLVDDLLDIARISAGKVELRLQRVELKDVIEQALEISRPAIEAMRHNLTVDIPIEPLTMNADPTRIAQVVSNLLNNAAKFTPEEGRIALSAQLEPDNLVIVVKDNGAGIPEDLLNTIFGMFVQESKQGDHHAKGGLGIGLALVRQMVELHGGTVSAISPGPGQGSTFTVRLPIPLSA